MGDSSLKQCVFAKIGEGVEAKVTTVSVVGVEIGIREVRDYAFHAPPRYDDAGEFLQQFGEILYVLEKVSGFAEADAIVWKLRKNLKDVADKIYAFVIYNVYTNESFRLPWATAEFDLNWSFSRNIRK